MLYVFMYMSFPTNCASQGQDLAHHLLLPDAQSLLNLIVYNHAFYEKKNLK